MRVAQPPKQVAGHGMRPTKFWSAAAAVLAATLAAGVLLVNGPHSGKADAATRPGSPGSTSVAATPPRSTSSRAGAAATSVTAWSSWAPAGPPSRTRQAPQAASRRMNIPVTFSVPMLPASGANIATVRPAPTTATGRPRQEPGQSWTDQCRSPDRLGDERQLVQLERACPTRPPGRLLDPHRQGDAHRHRTALHLHLVAWCRSDVPHRERLSGRRLRRQHRPERL